MADDFLNDPLWYKDAVIYELHVRSFYDSDDDGFGDFAGMRERLPYLERLGVNTLWLLPFLESPLRDDGYDISDYTKILPVHGSMDEFQAFLDEAHDRGMRVITELVLNHTSDQHPWFQEARDPNSDKHDWYVWSEDTDRYNDARIIFTDTEDSNWSWDAKAQKYYWHRFFSHQPDLNYDNPEVRETMKEVMYFWFDKGVDGLRLDAVPYLYEREGTNCENLPETIDFIKELRADVEERYGPGRVLLAEANQWPEDTLPYFADGDGVQMAFNFPIMPRMFMALRRENRRPFVEMLEMTNEIPDEVQWAIFLRNHDELTLEMVTDEERDYMYNEYGADPRFRINVGIRRRLTPLLGGDERRIELMNALLLSLKGSPIIYYGDEIGMGDDPFLGDRNGVRTPMQWSADKNGGFSRALHHKLFMPPVNRGRHSYEFVNVEDAEQNQHSLLNFMKRLLALRKQHVKTFGRGRIEVLPAENQSILAFIREHEGERILCVFNLSRFSQSTMLPDHDALGGRVPVEMFSQTAFPPFEGDPYHMLLGRHGFYWLKLEREEEIERTDAAPPEQATVDAEDGELPVLRVTEGLQNVLVRTLVEGKGLERFEKLLPDFLAKQRWFGRKGEAIRSVSLNDAVRLQKHPFPVYLSILNVEVAGQTEHYVLPLTTTREENAGALREEHSHACLAWVAGPHREDRGLLHDATVSSSFWKTLFAWWQQGGKGQSLKGVYLPTLDNDVRRHRAESVQLFAGEQSNSSAVIDDEYFVKLYRRLERGTNPETDLLDYLTEQEFPFVPRLHGTLSFRRSGRQYAMGVLQEALDVEENGWSHALTLIERFLNRVGDAPPPDEVGLPDEHTDEAPARFENVAPEILQMAQVLGIRTAELHQAFARAEAPDLAPQPGTGESSEALANRIRSALTDTRRLIDEREEQLRESDITTPFASDWEQAERQIDRLEHLEPLEERIRLHGDYHLGQVLRADGEFYVLDFEGEPARPLAERCQRDFALRDVAGMLRSLEYAALLAWRRHRDEAAEDEDEPPPTLETWTEHLARWCEALFLSGYYDTAGDAAFAQPEAARRSYLWAYLLEKALYEVRYELNHRPDWIWLPLRGLQRLLKEAHPASADGNDSEQAVAPDAEVEPDPAADAVRERDASER
jgi:maltose alpha-D-glucosyltransferase/alpha-amylase